MVAPHLRAWAGTMHSTKVALVTGSGRRRVGWHVADLLARRGYAVVLHYRTSAREAEAAAAAFRDRGDQALALQADLADEAEARRLVRAARDFRGRLDVLVN